jgi:hypothetical protein
MRLDRSDQEGEIMKNPAMADVDVRGAVKFPDGTDGLHSWRILKGSNILARTVGS